MLRKVSRILRKDVQLVVKQKSSNFEEPDKCSPLLALIAASRARFLLHLAEIVQSIATNVILSTKTDKTDNNFYKRFVRNGAAFQDSLEAY